MKILCIGDSLTEGYGINHDVSWPTLLGAKMSVPVFNEGISGDTTAGILARFSSACQRHLPTHTIIMGGTNDIDFQIDPKHIIANIKAMTRQARFSGIEYFIGIPMPYRPHVQDGYSSAFNSANEFANNLDEFRASLIHFCDHDETRFIDFSEELTTDHFLFDGIHPNEEGNRLMMETAYRALTG